MRQAKIFVSKAESFLLFTFYLFNSSLPQFVANNCFMHRNLLLFKDCRSVWATNRLSKNKTIHALNDCVKMVVFATTLSGKKIVISLCRRCIEEAFSEEFWTKLYGVYFNTSVFIETSNACFDGEFSYIVMGLSEKILSFRRGPILRLHFPVKKILQSSVLCEICKILVGLDTKSDIVKSRYKDAQVDLQFFFSSKLKGTWLLFVMQIILTLKDFKKRRKWENKKLVGFFTHPGRLFNLSIRLEIMTSRMNYRKAEDLKIYQEIKRKFRSQVTKIVKQGISYMVCLKKSTNGYVSVKTIIKAVFSHTSRIYSCEFLIWNRSRVQVPWGLWSLSISNVAVMWHCLTYGVRHSLCVY